MKSNDEPSVLIIGYGNSLRGDDGLGRAAAAMLEQSLAGHNVRVIDCHQLTPELAVPISTAQLVIFVDADRSTEPGVLNCRLTQPCAGEQRIDHHATPEQLIELAGALYGHAPLAYAITVGGAFWGYAQTLSPKVRASLPKVLDRVTKLVAVRSVRVNAEANHA